MYCCRWKEPTLWHRRITCRDWFSVFLLLCSCMLVIRVETPFVLPRDGGGAPGGRSWKKDRTTGFGLSSGYCCHAVQRAPVSKNVEVVEWHRSRVKNVSLTSWQFKIDWKSPGMGRNVLRRFGYGSSKLKRKICNGGPVLSEELNDTLLRVSGMRKKFGRWAYGPHLLFRLQGIF